MGLSDQIKVPAQVKGAVGGGGSFNPGGTSTQFLDGTGAPKDLSAPDVITALGGSHQYALATGGTTAYTIAPATPITLANGVRVSVRFPSTPAANATLNVGDGSGAHTILIKSNGTTRNTLAGDFISSCTYTFTYIADAAGYWLCDSGIQAVNNGLAHAHYTMTADDASTTTPALATWDTFVGQGITDSGNEATIGETGHYEICVSLFFISLSGSSLGIIALQDWTSGSGVSIGIQREGYSGSAQAYPQLLFRGQLTSGTKLRVLQYVNFGTGTIDGDGSTAANKMCFWEIRRLR